MIDDLEILEDISSQEFYNLLKSIDQEEINNFRIKDSIIIDIEEITLYNTIKNCVFMGSVEILDSKIASIERRLHRINFTSCNFYGIRIQKIYIDAITFSRISFEKGYLKVNRSNFFDFLIEGMIGENLDVDFKNNTFENNFATHALRCGTGGLTIRHNAFSKISTFLSNQTFINSCQFSRIDINQNNLGSSFAFVNNIVLDPQGIHNDSCSYISECIIDKFTFFNNNLSNIKFNDSIFNEITIIEKNTGNIFSFEDCVFKKTFVLNNCQAISIHVNKVFYENLASFQNTSTNTIAIDRTIFDKGSLFDDFSINHIDKCNRRTIRNIKQQLQKAENRIDYNRFRAYELQAYYKELKWFGNFKDKFILGATLLFTGFDHSWRRAVVVTILSGLLFYSLLYLVEFHIALNLNNNDNFTVGAFRFFMVTDFFSPFLDRKYLDNGISWTFFVLGKIVIAFGIYEMIQAFRKFKA